MCQGIEDCARSVERKFLRFHISSQNRQFSKTLILTDAQATERSLKESFLDSDSSESIFQPSVVILQVKNSPDWSNSQEGS